MYLNLTVTALRTLEKKEAVRSAEGVVRDRERGRAKASEQVGVATARVVEVWRRREEEEQEVVVEAAMAAMAMAGILAICCNKRVEVIPRKKRLPHTHTHTHKQRKQAHFSSTFLIRYTDAGQHSSYESNPTDPL